MLCKGEIENICFFLKISDKRTVKEQRRNCGNFISIEQSFHYWPISFTTCWRIILLSVDILIIFHLRFRYQIITISLRISSSLAKSLLFLLCLNWQWCNLCFNFILFFISSFIQGGSLSLKLFVLLGPKLLKIFIRVSLNNSTCELIYLPLTAFPK